MSEAAQVVIVGGGAFGTSIAYHLAELGIRDVLLLDRFGLADGTTWHSGGFLGQLRSEVPIMQLIAKSAELYPQLASNQSVPLDWHGVGSLRLATTRERFAEFASLVELASRAGVSASLISREEVAERAPDLFVEDLVGAVWIPSDGYVEPDTLPRSLAAEAARLGVTVRTETDVQGIDIRAGQLSGLRTSEGPVLTRHVVVAAGYATPQLAASAGVFVPIGVSRQQYLVSDPTPSDLGDFPTVREPDRSQYFRPMGRQVLLGAIAEEAGVVLPSDVPVRRRLLFDPRKGALEPAWEWCQHRLPALMDVDVERTIRGPEGVTTDGELIADESRIPGLWFAAGGNGHGVAVAGGLGWLMAGQVAHALNPSSPLAPVDCAPFALDRFPPSYSQDTQAMLTTMEQCELAHYSAVEFAPAPG